MKKLRFLSILLPVFLITFAFSTGAVCADIDPTLSDTVVSDPGGTAINPDDNVAGIAGILDDFNRANGGLGGNWTVRAGTLRVYNQEAQGDSLGLATYNGATSTVVEADVRMALQNGVQYAALVVNYGDINNNLFVKVQQSLPTGEFPQFTHYAFYWGNNGSNNSSFPNYRYAALDANFYSAHMKVEVVGSNATLTFSNINGGTGTQTYSVSGVPGTGGNAIGIGGYDYLARIDNFATPGGEECDYCLTDTYGFDWCLNVIATDSKAYYLNGTVQAGAPLYDAMATFIYSNDALSMTAYNGPVGYSKAFTFNTAFISSTRASGVWVSSPGGTGSINVDLVDCGSAGGVEGQEAGPRPTDIE